MRKFMAAPSDRNKILDCLMQKDLGKGTGIPLWKSDPAWLLLSHARTRHLGSDLKTEDPD